MLLLLQFQREPFSIELYTSQSTSPFASERLAHVYMLRAIYWRHGEAAAGALVSNLSLVAQYSTKKQSVPVHLDSLATQ